MESKSAILQMFNWRKNCGAPVKRGEGFARQAEKVNKIYAELSEKLKSMPELAELLREFDVQTCELESEEIDAHYADGFKFGLLIGIEAGTSGWE